MFSLPESRPYPGYEIERFESEGGNCGFRYPKNPGGSDNDKRLHQNRRIEDCESGETSRPAENDDE